MKRIANLLFGALILTLFACGGAGDPDVDSSATRMAFWGKVGTQDALYVTAPGDIKTYQKVTDLAVKSTYIRISPDRNRILWIESGNLNAVSSDGTGKVAFTVATNIVGADWGSDSDTILFEPSSTFEIRKTKFTVPTTNDQVLNNVYALGVNPGGTRMTFLPLGSTSVHFSDIDGANMDSLPAEPSGSNIVNPTYSAYNQISYLIAATPTCRIKFVDLEASTPTVTEVGGTVGALSGSPIAVSRRSPVGASFTTGPGGFVYSLNHYLPSGVVQLDTSTTGSITRVCSEPGDPGLVAYTKGNGLFTVPTAFTGPPSQQMTGLDSAGYCDWR